MREAMREPAFVVVGVLLLASGFALQLAGYVVASGQPYLAGFAVGVILLAFGGGFVAASRFVDGFLRRALKAWRELKAEQEAKLRDSN